MSILFMVWCVFASVTARGIQQDLQSEKKQVTLFTQCNSAYKTYKVEVQ